MRQKIPNISGKLCLHEQVESKTMICEVEHNNLQGRQTYSNIKFSNI